MKMLLVAAGLFLSLATAAFAHDISLAGTSWAMTDGSGRSITFSAGGKVSGFAGCNRFFGSYTQSGDRLRIKTIGATRMGCFKGKGASDGPFLGLMAATRRFVITNAGLTLQTGGRAALAAFRRK